MLILQDLQDYKILKLLKNEIKDILVFYKNDDIDYFNNNEIDIKYLIKLNKEIHSIYIYLL